MKVDHKRQANNRAVDPATVLQGSRSQRKKSRTTMLRQWVGRFYIEIARRMARAARRAHARIMSMSVSKSAVALDQALLTAKTAITDMNLVGEFDYEKWQDAAWSCLPDYSFVPQDSLAFHTLKANNRYGIHKLNAQIALFPSSNPLILFRQSSSFLFEKLHEIPYHGAGSSVYITEFAWSTVIRPSFKIVVDIDANYDTFRVTKPAIYMGGSLNFGHFLTDYYPRFLAMLEEGRRNPALAARLPRLVIVYCEDEELEYLLRTHPDYRFVNLKGYEGSLIACSEIYVTSFVRFPMACSLLRRQLQGVGQDEGSQSVASMVDRPRKRVFLSRRGFSRRRIGNEDQLISMLEELGFDILDVKQYSIEDLANRIKEYDLLVSAFGAHTNNAIFLKPGSTFYEIVTDSFDRSSGWQYNHSLFMSAGLKYFRVVAEDAQASPHGQEGAAGVYDWEAHADVAMVREQLLAIMEGGSLRRLPSGNGPSGSAIVDLSTAPTTQEPVHADE